MSQPNNLQRHSHLDVSDAVANGLQCKQGTYTRTLAESVEDLIYINCQLERRLESLLSLVESSDAQSLKSISIRVQVERASQAISDQVLISKQDIAELILMSASPDSHAAAAQTIASRYPNLRKPNINSMQGILV